jgi:hypothetical protein
MMERMSLQKKQERLLQQMVIAQVLQHQQQLIDLLELQHSNQDLQEM